MIANKYYSNGASLILHLLYYQMIVYLNIWLSQQYLQNLFLATVWICWLFLYLKRNKLIFHLKMEDAKTQRWILRTVSCSFLSDHPFNFYTMTIKMSHILQRTSAHLFLLTHACNGTFHFIFQNFWAWFSTVTLLERSIDPCKCPRIQWIYIGIKLEIVGQREPRLSAVGLWEKSLPFLLSFPGIHFVFLDFVIFAQLGSSFIVHTSVREVVSREEALAMFLVFGH